MTEINLSRKQIGAIETMAAEHQQSVRLTSPPSKYGDLFDRTYVQVELIDAEGEVISRDVFGHAGVRPKPDGKHPEWT